MNLISFNASFIRIPLLSIALIALTNTAIAGGPIGEHSLMNDFLRSKVSMGRDFSVSTDSPAYNNETNNALVFNRGAIGVDNHDFDEKFSLARTLTSIRYSTGLPSHRISTLLPDNFLNTQLLNSLLNTFKVSSKTNGFVKMDLQIRDKEKEVSLSDMSPTAIFNRFDLSASNGEHCGEYRIIYHKNNGARFFLAFEAQYPNPDSSKGKRGCFALADFWQEIGKMNKADALVQLEKFFYKGLVHKGVKLPAVVDFTHYTHGTGQVRSNSSIQKPWQLREFKTDISAKGKVIFVADTVKSNPLTRLFVNKGDLPVIWNMGPYSPTDFLVDINKRGLVLDLSTDTSVKKENSGSYLPTAFPAKKENLETDSLKTLRAHFNRDFGTYVDNLLAPERRASNPSPRDIINGFSLDNDDSYNEFQSDSNEGDNTANGRNENLSAIISKKLTALNLSNYSVQMIRNRAEAMSCGGCHQNSNDAEIAPNVHWPKSGSFVHVDEKGALSPALTEQFLPARAALLKDYLQETIGKSVEKWRFAEPDYSSAMNDFDGPYNASNLPNQVAFAALKTDGSITAWGDSSGGGAGAPTGSGYTKIYSNWTAFAALKADGSITAWGDSDSGGTGAPTGSGYTKIYSTGFAFAALKADGSITAWGDSDSGGTGAPTGSGYTKIYSTMNAFAALKADGSIMAWGGSDSGSTGAPTGSGYTKIYSTMSAFAALKADGSITAWGDSDFGGAGAPTGSGYTKIYSTRGAFSTLKADGSITAWGDPDWGSTGAPTGSGYTKIYSTAGAFATVKADGSITAWGGSDWGGTGAPTGSGYAKIYSTGGAFATLKADGSITAWGGSYAGGTGAPTGSGYTKIYSTAFAFAAVKADGSITAWGGSDSGGTGAPTGSGHTKIYSTVDAFVAVKADGSITAWGNPNDGGTTPTVTD